MASEHSRWIIDTIYVSLRSGPGTEFRIVERALPSGTRMEATGLDESGEWTQVTLNVRGESTEGWIPTRYIEPEPIARDLLATAEKKLAEAQSRIESLTQQLSQTASKAENASDTLSSLREERDELRAELDRVIEVSANALTLDERNGELLQENQQLKNELDVLRVENQYLNESNVSQEWMVGGTIAFIGLLGGFLLSRAGKRSGKQNSWA